MAWFRRHLESSGAALFPGKIPPRLDNIVEALRAAGAEPRPMEARPGSSWQVEAAHPRFGQALIVLPEEGCVPPPLLLDLAGNLTEQERQAGHRAGCSVLVRVQAREGQVLRDRKRFLGWLRLVLGEHGAIASDASSLQFWSPAALDFELSHDADLDVEAIHTLHHVKPEDGGSGSWLHSHGLAEVGTADYDVIDPSPAVTSDGGALRAIAFGLLEGRLTRGGEALLLMRGERGPVEVTLVDVRDFNRRAPRIQTARRDVEDPEHNQTRGVLCEPQGRHSLLDRRPGASLALKRFSGGGLIMFSDEASLLMAARARETFPFLRSAFEELAPLALPAMVKLRYETDSGSAEHLWFEVKGLKATEIDATLVNDPFDIARMTSGQRGTHDLGRLSDWVILTPFGSVSPRSTTALRRVREDPVELTRLLAEARQPV